MYGPVILAFGERVVAGAVDIECHGGRINRVIDGGPAHDYFPAASVPGNFLIGLLQKQSHGGKESELEYERYGKQKKYLVPQSEVCGSGPISHSLRWFAITEF